MNTHAISFRMIRTPMVSSRLATVPADRSMPVPSRAAPRLGVFRSLRNVQELLGERLRTEFVGWKAAVLVNDLELGKHLGLRARQANGPI